MTKKSASRLSRDAAAGKRIAAAREVPLAPVSRAPLKATENGGYKLSAADRILQECSQGLGMVPQKPANTCWDDLMAVYRECANMLFQHTAVTQVLNNKDLLNYMDDLPTFNANVKQFAVDLGQMNKELQDLFALHSDKSGGSEDPHVVLHSFGIFEQYKLWMSKHDGVVKPTILHILDMTNRAEQRKQLADYEAAQQLEPTEELDAGVIDVNQITDVDFKESIAPTGIHLNLGDTSVEQAQAIVEVGMSQRGHTAPIYTLDEAGFYGVV